MNLVMYNPVIVKKDTPGIILRSQTIGILRTPKKLLLLCGACMEFR